MHMHVCSHYSHSAHVCSHYSHSAHVCSHYSHSAHVCSHSHSAGMAPPLSTHPDVSAITETHLLVSLYISGAISLLEEPGDLCSVQELSE